MTEILETFPRVFCFPKSHINENGGKGTKQHVKASPAQYRGGTQRREESGHDNLHAHAKSKPI